MITSRRPADRAAPRAADKPGGRRVDWALFGLLTVALLVFFAQLYPRRDWYFGVGPDGPVYLWWTRLAAHDGLSAVGTRPGVPALALVLRGTMRSSIVEALAAIGVAGAVCIGLAAATLVHLGTGRTVGSRDRRLRYVAAGALAGTFAVHLADGYLANLLQAGLFLAAAALLAAGTTRATVAAGLLLAASAVTHPQFFELSALILGLTALLTLLRRPSGTPWRDVEGTRIVASVLGGGAVAGAGFAALLSGPGLLRVDTSEDAFLRRAGLGDVLRHQYRGRFFRHLARYVLPLQIPLGLGGLSEGAGFLGRFLGTWGVVLVVGVAGSVLTERAPAVRFVAFAYVLPILAALGLVRLHLWVARRRNRVIAALLAAGLGIGIVTGAAITWSNAQPYLSRAQLSRAATAGRIARAVPRGTPLVFVVDTTERNVAFFAVRAINVIRDAVPADRIRDVYLYVGSPTSYLGDRTTHKGRPVHDAMSRLYLDDIDRLGGHPLAFVLAPMNREFFDDARAEGDLVSRGVVVLRPHPPLGSAPRATGPPPSVPPSSGWKLALFSVAALVVLTAMGFGWARIAVAGPAALGLAPAFGAGGAILAAILLERFGAPLTGWAAPAASAIVGGGGYLAMLLSRRRELTVQAHPVDEAPPELP